MKIHDHVNGECYTLKILCPEVSKTFLKEQRRLENYFKKIFPIDKIHIGLKYIAYENDYSDDYMISLVPEIKKIVEKYMPMKIEVQGVGGFWDRPEWPSCPIIFLRVKLTDELKEFHNNLRKLLKNKVDSFPSAEGNNYIPHITLGVGNEKQTKELKKIIEKSKFSESVSFIANKFAMRLKGGKIHHII